MLDSKYFILSQDICRLLERKQWRAFATYNITNRINEGTGFYRYSKSTLYRAIDLLIEQGKVHKGAISHNGHRTYIYLPIPSRWCAKWEAKNV